MLRVNAHTKFIDHFECRRIDHPNVVGATVGYVDAWEVFCDNRAELIRPRFAVEIVGIDDRRHTREGLDGSRRGATCLFRRPRKGNRRGKSRYG